MCVLILLLVFAVAVAPQTADGLRRLGVQAFEQGRYDDAKEMEARVRRIQAEFAYTRSVRALP